MNTCLQAIFRIPEVQERYDAGTFYKGNLVDECLCKIWKTKGEEGLKEFFEVVRTDTMPAGQGIGDTHELLQYICDKLSYLDNLVRFKVANSVQCIHCGDKSLVEDSVTEFSIATHGKNVPMIDCIAECVKEHVIEEWKCEKCGQNGCRKQQLIGTFPKVMMFHSLPTNGSIDYSSILGLNKRQYALLSVSCFDGGHWWSYGRNMPPGSSWYTLNDRQVHEHGPKQFPVSNRMRLLIYYRLEN